MHKRAIARHAVTQNSNRFQLKVQIRVIAVIHLNCFKILRESFKEFQAVSRLRA